MTDISVAIIDDDPTTVYLYRKSLTKKGYRVFGTSSVDAFFSYLRNNHPGLSWWTCT